MRKIEFIIRNFYANGVITIFFRTFADEKCVKAQLLSTKIWK